MCDVLTCGRPSRRGKYSDAFCDDCWQRLIEEIDQASDNMPSSDWNFPISHPHWSADGWDRYYELVGA